MLDVVEHISDAIDWNLLALVEPIINDLEDLLALISFANISNNVFTVRTVDAQHLGCIFFKRFSRYCLPQSFLPRGCSFRNDARECNANKNEELLMNVEHQVLQICVNARQRVNRGLLIGNQVVELHNTDRYCLQLLGFNHDLL